MEEAFPWAFRPVDEELTRIWAEATISFDASALLNVYQYRSETRDQLLDAMDKLGDRLWFSYRSLDEYLTKREHVVVRQHSTFEPIGLAFAEATTVLRKYEKNRSINPQLLTIDLKQLHDIAKRAKDEAKQILGKARQDLVDAGDDPFLRRLTGIVGDRIGRALDEAEREDRYQEARERYDRKEPPGYLDDTKDEPAKFGDYLIWRELLDHARESRKAMVFVTDDLKADWWLWQGDKLIGAQPQLTKEMQRVAGVGLHLATSDDFLHHAQQNLGIDKDEAVIKEVREVSRRSQSPGFSFLEQAAGASAIRAGELAMSRAAMDSIRSSAQDATMAALPGLHAAQQSARGLTSAFITGLTGGMSVAEIIGSSVLSTMQGVYGGAPFDYSDEDGESDEEESGDEDDDEKEPVEPESK